MSDEQVEAPLLGGACRQQLPQVSEDQVLHAACRPGVSQSSGFWEFSSVRQRGERAAVMKVLNLVHVQTGSDVTAEEIHSCVLILKLCVCVCVCVCVLPCDSAAVFVVAEALLPGDGDGGSMEAPGSPQVPGQNRQRVSVDQTTTRRHQGTVMTRRQLRRRREKKKKKKKKKKKTADNVCVDSSATKNSP